MRQHLMTPLRLKTAFLAFCLFLSGCTEFNSSTDEAVINPDPSTPRSLTDWKIDPDFKALTLDDAETRAWYKRVQLEIDGERAQKCLPPGTSPQEYPSYPGSATVSGCSGIKSYIGRGVQSHALALLTLFRLTGDAELLAELDRVMEIAKAQLSDTDGDGYRNWHWLTYLDKSDFNLKEDSLAHGFIPEIIFAFQKNAEYSTPEHDYSGHAEEWLVYLRDDFEAKWATRSATSDSEGLPLSPLMHPYIEMLRYTVYMAKLVPEDAKYRRLEQHLSAIVLNEFKTDKTAGSEAFVWSHAVRYRTPDGDPNICLDFQMETYPNRTMMIFMDLALEGVAGFSSSEAMTKLSQTLSESILDPNPIAFMYKDVGGLRNGSLDPASRRQTRIGGWCFQEAPFTPNDDPTNNFRPAGSYTQLNYAFLAAFAADDQTHVEETEIYQVNRQIYGDPADGKAKLKSPSIPAAMAFARLYAERGYTLKN